MARPLPLLLLLALACRPVAVAPVLEPPQDSDAPSPDDTDTDPEDIGDNPADPSENGWIFSVDDVWEVGIELEADAVKALEADPLEYVPGALTFEGHHFEQVGVRLKGRLGAFRDLSAKAAFKIDMNRYAQGQTLDGLEKLTFNNMVVDCSGMKELLAWKYFELIGVPAARVGYVWVSVNGEVYGLYAHVESIDDEFLERHYEEPDGNLYEGEYLLYDNGDYTLADFEICCDQYITLDEGEDNWEQEVRGVTLALNDYEGQPDFYEGMATVVNWPHHHRTIAASTWAGHNDGYSLNSNNFRPYYDPGDEGRMAILSWDMDYAFYEPHSWSLSWSSPRGRLSDACVNDATCLEAQRAVISGTRDRVDTDAMLELHATARATVSPMLEQDPREECGSYYTSYYQSYLYDWIVAAEDRAMSTWGVTP